MNIGYASSCAGLPARTLRYYVDVGLVRPQARSHLSALPKGGPAQGKLPLPRME